MCKQFMKEKRINERINGKMEKLVAIEKLLRIDMRKSIIDCVFEIIYKFLLYRFTVSA